MSRIKKVAALEILDSRGNPTIQVNLMLESGAHGVAKVPSGASTGRREAVELRDGVSNRYKGQGVLNAIKNVEQEIQPAVVGMDAADQQTLDEKLVLSMVHPTKRDSAPTPSSGYPSLQPKLLLLRKRLHSTGTSLIGRCTCYQCPC